ncbi:methyl-accepting chemotaxis protein [Dissulfurirhabdus thermomarina]|uniref:Methyl-accepting chemotaxis protein n=1 Tax=Dissulfurirhabdus thermomarina TaxID=1765737 RepID=A0A6N9TQL8_DISTH|nr:methyl-accepting chemotaxis protein [Dissulfurirhabdus thermomarina]NDY42403.1 methyl-accepting chemotaxis protein [Dissulfurirhabdus thermomarina]NMX23227.1 methyl-accepting chemotaxis protein [Dissulfurirhabdus thermomarina]
MKFLPRILGDRTFRFQLTALSTLLLCLLALAGAAGIDGMRRANIALAEIAEDHMAVLRDVNELLDVLMVDVSGTVQRVLAGEVAWKEGRRRLEAALADAEGYLEGLDGRMAALGGTSNRHLVQAMGAEVAQMEEGIRGLEAQLQGLLAAGDRAGLERFQRRRLPAISRELHERAGNILEAEFANIRLERRAAERRYGMALVLTVALLGAGILTAVLSVVFLVRRLDRSFGLLRGAMDRLRRGDLAGRVDYGQRDEFRPLAQGFNEMAEALHELVGEIQKSGISVNSSVTELSATSREQESSASELAATCSEIAASSTEIAATSARLLETMKGVAELASETAEAAGEGHEGLSRIDETISRMESATGSIVSKLGVLSEKAGNIAGVVKTINKVADQTNLLSLNAAIEAEKAGEYGAGFAVVATEIRRLADQTAVATYDIEQMVQEVQSAVSSGVMGMDKFAEDVRGSVKEIRRIGATLSEVIQRVQALTPHIEEVNEGMVSQSQGAQQISDAIMQLNESVQQMAASLVQTGETVNQLRDVAVGLRESVSRFRVEG